MYTIYIVPFKKTIQLEEWDDVMGFSYLTPHFKLENGATLNDEIIRLVADRDYVSWQDPEVKRFLKDFAIKDIIEKDIFCFEDFVDIFYVKLAKECAVTSNRYNFRHFSFLSDKKFILTLTGDKDWDGSCKHLPFECMSNKRYVSVILGSWQWNGDCQYIGKNIIHDPDIQQKIFYSFKWDGSCKYFSREFLRENILKIMGARDWNGSAQYIPSDIHIDPNFLYKKILKSGKWNGSVKYFDYNSIDDIESFYHFVTKQSKWDGSVEYFPESIRRCPKFHIFLRQGNSRNWDRNEEYFIIE